MDFQRKGFKFFNKGVQLTRPEDLLEEGKYNMLQNVRSYSDGTLVPRLGIGSGTAGPAASPTHSIKRFFDISSGASNEVTGCGTLLAREGVSVSTGFSGRPLSFVAMRPFSDVENWLYVADTNKMVKVNRSGTVSAIGLTPPLVALSAALASTPFTTINNFDTTGDWTQGGTAGAPALIGAKRVDTTITYILYDSGSTGWASVVPAVLDNNTQAGLLLTFNGTEVAMVEEVFNAIKTTTIGSIKYDSGTTGACTIQLAAPSFEGLRRDAVVRLGGAENVRILSVTPGPEGLPSFRCVTTGTRAAGNAVAGLGSFRVNLTGTFVATNTLTAEAIRTSVTVGIGYLTQTAAFDLSTISSRPVGPEDEIHISVRLDAPANLTEGKVFFNVDTVSTAFDKNYFYFPFTASSLIPATEDTLTTASVQQNVVQQVQIRSSYAEWKQRLLQREGTFNDNQPVPTQADEPFPVDTPLAPLVPNPVPNEATTGDSQWTELRFKVKDLLQVGSDKSRTIANVNAIRIQFNVTATTACDVDSLWIGGTYGLNSNPFPYVWTYCYKARATGVVSNPAPPMRSGVLAHRGRVVLTPTVSADAQVTQIDYFRFGGTLPEWHYVGSTPNSGTFTDTQPDEVVNGNFGLDFDNFKPFPMADSSRTGTCDVVGTEIVQVSGDTFNTAWERGSEIVIDGVPTSLYTSPTSTTRLSVEDSMGTKTGVVFILPSPTLRGQPVPVIWGPYSISGVSVFFGCKAGNLYFTKGNNPDASPETYQIELTSPSEPLVNGCVYDGQCYVFSTERLFRIIPTAVAGSPFEAQEVPVGKGLFAPWALCVDELITFVSRDGIYQTNGTEIKSISDADLYPILPHDGQAGVATKSYLAPNFSGFPESLRLAAGDGLIKFTYKDTGGTYRTHLYDTRAKAWTSLDTYTPQVVCHYWDEGGVSTFGSTVTRERVGSVNGNVYTANASPTDDGNAITLHVRTKSEDLDETRAQKLFGDVMLDHAGTATITPSIDSFATDLLPQTVVQAGRGQTVLDLVSGGGRLGRNLGLDITSTDPSFILYEWQPSFVPRPEDSKLRWMDYDDDGSPEAKFLQGVVLEADTSGSTRTVQVQGDNGIVIGNLVVNHNGLSVFDYPQAGDAWTPQPTHMMRLVPSDANQWKIFKVRWIWEPCPPLANKWQNQGTSHGFEDFHHLRRLWVGLISTDVVTLTLTADGVPYTYTIPSTGGVYAKKQVPLQAVKAKIWNYLFTSSQGFRLFLNDSIVEALGWGLNGPYKNIQPFGAIHHYQTQARI